MSGFLHGELTTLLWGGAFGFAWTYTVVARLLVARHPRVRRPRGRLTPTPGSLTFVTEAAPPAPAFFQWALVAQGVHSPGRTFRRTATLGSPDTALTLGVPRGRYEVEVHWEMTDLFGLTRLVPPARWTTVHTQVPVPTPFSPPPPPATKPGPWRPRRSGRRAGDPFDVRPYAAGDDLRRLHWPLYAHSGVPFVRTAEPAPPPTGHQFLVLDLEAATEEDLDRRLGALVTWLDLLDHQETGWTLAIPAAGQTLGPGPQTKDVLAGLSPAPFPEGPVEPGWPGSVTLITGPGSQGAVRLTRRLAGSRRRVRPVVVPGAEPAAIAPRAWWER